MQFQRMTVIDLPMSLVYGGVALGCFLMLLSPGQALLAQRAGRAGASPSICPANTRPPTKPGPAHDRPDLRVSRRADRGRAGVHRAGGLLAPLHALSRGHPRLRHPASHGRRHRQLPAAGRAVLHPRRQPHELRRHHQPHLRLRRGDRRLDARRPRARQHHRLGHLRGHVGHGDCRCGRPRHDRDQGHEGPWLRHRVRGRRHRRLGDAGADHPAVAAVRDLRHDGQCLDRRPVSRRHRAGRR